MSWWAKPSGAYLLESEESYANADEIYTLLGGTWTLTAICGMLGNMWSESGMNPWRWQYDTVTYSGGYGLVQFTPAKDTDDPMAGYIDGFGVQYEGYAPNMSTSTTTTGANVRDGEAQIQAINNNAGGKYTSYKRHCDYADITSVNEFSDYKQCEDLWVATVGWLYYYEAPRDKSYTVAKVRFEQAKKFWEHFTENPPVPPTPPSPVHHYHKMPLYMYLRRL